MGERVKAEYLKPSIYNNLYPYMTYDNVLALRVALVTGLRIGDVLRIRPCDVDTERGRLVYTAQKTGKGGTKKIPIGLARELLRNAGGSLWCFPHRLDSAKHRTREAVYRNLLHACKRAGLDVHVSPHSTRKTYAVELRDVSGLAEVQKQLQHDSLDVTMLYAFSDVVDAVNRPHGGNGSIGTADICRAVYDTVQRSLSDYFSKRRGDDSGGIDSCDF